ncbi:MAG: ATP-binding cassette domain-containing protein [Bacteroidia bacterium]|nr:ATP-binding cassette domain-containing protein [Bacteroidia bacterium]
MTPFLELQAVTKAYDRHLAVDAVSFSVPRGRVFGLLGPNGAGKTTTIRMITGIIGPDSGTILFDGEPLAPAHARRMGYMPEERGLYKKVKVLEQVVYLLMLKGLSRQAATRAAHQWLDRLGLEAWKNRNTTDLSKGMHQKVQFITTVAHQPSLLILDEPFSGLDPVNARVVEEEIMRLRDEGATIIFSTHRLEQVEEFCDYIVLINQGKVILQDEITAVRQRFRKNLYALEFAGDPASLSRLQGVQLSEVTARSALMHAPDDAAAREALRQILDLPLELHKFELHLPSLNDIFIELVSGQAA